MDLVIRNNPDDNKDGIVDDIYLNFACSSYYEKFNVPIENLVVGQKYILTFTESNDAIFGKSSTGYGNAIYGSIITTNGTLSSGSIKSESISDGGLIAQFSDVSKGDEWLNGPRNWEMTFTAEDTTMYWTWDMGLIQDGSLYNYNFRNIKITPVQPEIEFSNKTIIKNSGSTAEITSQTNSTYSTEFSFDGDSGCEVVYYPITGLSSGLTYTIEFEHEFNGNLINSSSYDYGCGIMNSEPTSNPAKLSSLDIDSNKFILSSLSNDTEAVTLTFTATGDAAYWVWNMANCSDSEVGTVSIKVIGFSVEDSNGTSLEYDINVNASTFNLRRNTVNVVETVETSYIASASNASRIENDIISKTESDIASDSNASKTESDIASDSNASKD